MIGIRVSGRIGKGGIWGENCLGDRAESLPGVPGLIHCLSPAGFRAWSHLSPWAGSVG